MALKPSQKSLKEWTKQKSSEGKKRYLPEAAWKGLSAQEKAATNKAKATGNKAGKQFVPQPKAVARKVAKYR